MRRPDLEVPYKLELPSHNIMLMLVGSSKAQYSYNEDCHHSTSLRLFVDSVLVFERSKTLGFSRYCTAEAYCLTARTTR